MKENYPTRKPHRLSQYDYRTPGAYFVTFCTKDRRPVLSQIRTGTSVVCPPEINLSRIGIFLDSAIAQIPARYPSVSVEQYVIMPNHIHMLLRLTSEDGPSLSQIVQQLKGYVTKQCGFPVWQEKYYDHVIRDESDFLTKYQYICNNPARWAEDEYYSKP